MEIVLNLANTFQRIHADGRIELQPRMFLVGQMDRATHVQPAGPVCAFGVRFQPGGAYPFLWFPQHETAGQIVQIESIERRLAQQLEQAALGADGDRARMARIQSVLLQRLRARPEPRIESALHSMLAFPEQSSLHALTVASGWSERQFRRRFQEVVGIGPKVYSRILRFQRALRAIDRAGPIPAGYYDQAHFIREFKSFGGETPAAYASRIHPLADHFVKGV